MVVFFEVVAVIPLIIWYSLYPISVEDVMISSTTYCWLCTYPTATIGNWGYINISEVVVLIWCSLLIVISAFLAFKVII